MRHLAWPAWLTVLLSLVAGSLMRLAFSPVGWWPLAVLLPAFMLWLLAGRGPRQVLLLGWLFGFATFAVGTPWIYISIHEFGHVWAPAAAVLMLLFSAVVGLFPAISLWLAARLSAGQATSFLVLAPFSWVLLEWVKSWFLSGFPWLSLGYSQTDTPLMALAPLGGVFLISLVVMLLAAALAMLCIDPGKRCWAWRRPLAAMVLSAVMVATAQWLIRPAQPEDEWSIAIAQGNFGQDIKFDRDWLMPQIDYYRQTTLANADVDLVLWPETVLPPFYDRLKEPLFNPLGEHLSERGGALVAGAFHRSEDGQQVYNAVVTAGLAEGIYLKRKLVPLGEFFPFKPLLRLLPGLDIPLSDMSPGPREQTLLRVHGQPIGVSICYEDAFGALLLHDVPEARLLINVSNDAWFGRRAPWQHLQMARMRAAEVQRAMARSTTTGVSALIGPGGELLSVAEPFEQVVLRGQLPLLDGHTPYMIWADWPVVVLCLLPLAFAGWGRR